MNILIKNLDKLGFDIEVQKYFLRRGYFAKEIARKKRPEKFYEYLFVLKKISVCSVSEDFVISSKISRTYARQRPLVYLGSAG